MQLYSQQLYRVIYAATKLMLQVCAIAWFSLYSQSCATVIII